VLTVLIVRLWLNSAWVCGIIALTSIDIMREISRIADRRTNLIVLWHVVIFEFLFKFNQRFWKLTYALRTVSCGQSFLRVGKKTSLVSRERALGKLSVDWAIIPLSLCSRWVCNLVLRRMPNSAHLSPSFFGVHTCWFFHQYRKQLLDVCW